MIGRLRWFIVVAVIGGLLTTLYLGRGAILPAAAAWLDVGGPPQPADAVLVLNGDVNTRPFAAATLIKNGWAPRILVAGVAPSPAVRDGTIRPWHEIYRQVLQYCGVPPKDIVVLDGEARSTYDEAVALAKFLDGSPRIRLLVVTDGPHTRRSRWILARVLGDRVRQISMVSSPCEECQVDTWWQNEVGFAFVVGEYLKLAFYAVRYGNLGYGASVLVGTVAAALSVYWWRRTVGCERVSKANVSDCATSGVEGQA